MMREVLQRRFARALKEDPERDRGMWPDLVLIDGGLGQLNVAQGVFDELGIGDIAIGAIAKGPDRNAGREHLSAGASAILSRPSQLRTLLFAASPRRGAPLCDRHAPSQTDKGAWPLAAR